MGSSIFTMNSPSLPPGTFVHQDSHTSLAAGQQAGLHSIWEISGVTATQHQGLAYPQEEDDAVLLELEFKHTNLPEG